MFRSLTALAAAFCSSVAIAEPHLVKDVNVKVD